MPKKTNPNTSLRFAVTLCAITVIQPALSMESVETNSMPLRYEEPRLLTGRIYAKNSDRKNPLFHFRRQATRSGTMLQVLREYTYPDGRAAARERLVYSGDNLVSFEVEELQ